MLNAIVVSKFPKGFLEGSITKKLVEKGIYPSQFILPSQVSDNNQFDCDVVLLMHEMISHSDFYRIRGYLERKQKKFAVLSRKSSRWDQELKFMGAPHAVTDDQLRSLITEYIELRTQDKPNVEVAPLLGKYWRSGNVTSGGLGVYLRALIDRGRCPPDLAPALGEALQKRVAPFPRLVPPSDTESAPEVIGEAGATPELTESTPDNDSPLHLPTDDPPKNPDDWASLANLYSEQNDKLRDELTRLRADNQRLSKENEKLKAAGETRKANVVKEDSPLQTLRIRGLVKSLESTLTESAKLLFEMEKTINK